MTWTTRPRSKRDGLACIVEGSGRPIFMIHGVGLRAEAWARQIDLFNTHHQVIAVDMPGHGESTAFENEAPQLADYVDAIAPLVPNGAIVMGHSMGAMIALEIAGAMGDRLAGVVAMNAIFRRTAQAALAVQARAASILPTKVPDPTAPLDRWFGSDPSPERDACREWLLAVDPRAYRAAYHVFAHHDGPSNDTLARMTCPALFITGADEPNSTPDMSRAMAVRCRLGQSHIVQNAAHMMPMTHADDVWHVLRPFIAEVGAQT